MLTDTLYVDIDEKVKKKFRLTVDSIRRYLHPDFGLFGHVSVIPDTVWIEGPRRVVHALPDTLTLSLQKRNITKDFKEEVEIVFSNNQNVTRDPPVIEVEFEVEKMMEVNDHVALELRNAPSRVRLAMKGKEINFTYRLPGSLLKKSPPDSVRAIIDLNEFARGNYRIIPILEGLPPQAYLVKIDTIRIDL